MSNVCGTGSWGGPLPGDPDNTSVLSATPAFGGIDVAWSLPSANSHAVAFVWVYRGLSDDFNGAIRIAAAAGSNYFDKIDANARYYYWIQIISINGTTNEIIGPASAVAKLIIEQVIEQLTGKIDNGVLAEALKSEIARITLLDIDIANEIQNRLAGNQALADVLAQVQTEVGEFATVISEEITQRQDGDSALVTAVNAIAVSASSNTAAILQEQTVRATADSALAANVSTLFANVGNNTAAIQTEQTARSTADSALSTQISSVSAVANASNRTYTASTAPTAGMVAGDIWYNTSNGNKTYRYSGTVWVLTDDTRIASNAAAIQIEQTARANGDSANASFITNLTATVNSNQTSGLAASSAAQITADIAKADAALAAGIAGIKGKVLIQSSAPLAADQLVQNLWIDTTNDANQPKRWTGSAWSAVTDKAATDAAAAAVAAQTTANQALAAAAVNAASIQTEQTVRANADSSLATQITTVQSSATAANTAAAAANTAAGTAQTAANTNTAAIQTEVTARTNADSALATQINTVESSSASNLASAQTLLQTNISTVNGKVTDIGALYTAKVNVNSLVGGFGIYNDGTEVEAGFDVDRFWIGRTNGDKRKPFIVDGGVVYIDDAAIRNASITTAKIEDAAITAAKIGSLALVGTSNFNVKSSLTGARMEMDNQLIKVFDASGTLRVKIGNLDL